MEAATRLCNHISIPKGVSRDVLPYAVLRVLDHVEYDLPAYLENGTHWRDGNGTLKRLTPDHWLPYEVLEWLKIEAVRAARAMQGNDSCYSPSIILSVIPDEHNPLPLWRPLEQTLIAIDRGGNRFGSGIFGETRDDFLAVLTPVVLGLINDNKPPHMEAVAEALHIEPETIKKRRRLMEFKTWREVVQEIIAS